MGELIRWISISLILFGIYAKLEKQQSKLASTLFLVGFIGMTVFILISAMALFEDYPISAEQDCPCEIINDH